jgi:hypothetical protein
MASLFVSIIGRQLQMRLKQAEPIKGELSGLFREPRTNPVNAEDIITPEELAAYSLSLRSPRGSRNRAQGAGLMGLREDPEDAAVIHQSPAPAASKRFENILTTRCR